MDKIVFSSLIAFNEMLTSHCDNLLTYIPSLFWHAISSCEDEEPPEMYNGALPDALQLEWYKKYKDKETRTLLAFKSLTFFTLFMLVLGIVCYGSRDYHHYLIVEQVRAIFPRTEQVSTF